VSAPGRLLRIVAPHFCAGVVVSPRGVIVEAAPILGYALGWTGRRLREYAGRKGWEAAYVETGCAT